MERLSWSVIGCGTALSLILSACGGGSTDNSNQQRVASVQEKSVAPVLPAGPQSTFTLAIPWMGDITSDGTSLYMSTMIDWRPIIKIDPTTGQVLATIPQNPFCTAGPRGAAFDGPGRLLLTSMSPTVCELDISGNLIRTFTVPDPVPNGNDGLRTGPIAFDGTNVYVGDTDNLTVLVTDLSGNLIRYFNPGSRPDGMVFDPLTGHLWLVDLVTPNKLSEISMTGDLVRVCDISYNPGAYGLGGVAILGSKFYISEPQNPSSPGDGTIINVYERSQLVCNPALSLTVTIDIKPGSSPNSVNPNSKGVIPVAILSTTSFDASMVDASKVRFGKTGNETGPTHFAFEDVNGDGMTDAIFQFDTQATGIQCGDKSASLTGQTTSGLPLTGADSIQTTGCK